MRGFCWKVENLMHRKNDTHWQRLWTVSIGLWRDGDIENWFYTVPILLLLPWYQLLIWDNLRGRTPHDTVIQDIVHVSYVDRESLVITGQTAAEIVRHTRVHDNHELIRLGCQKSIKLYDCARIAASPVRNQRKKKRIFQNWTGRFFLPIFAWALVVTYSTLALPF